ncbi:MAG TPA: hypothetical protein VJA47_06555 [archaeon]|nr:hypothetical protein [archaeon]
MKEGSKRALGAIIVLIMLFSIAGSALFYTQTQQPEQEQPKTEIQQITERALTADERLFILRAGGVVVEYTYKDLNYTRKTEIEDFILKKTEGKAILSEYKSEEDKLEMIGIDQTNPRAAEVRNMKEADSSALFDNFCQLVLAQPKPLDCTLKGLNIGGQPSPTTNTSVQNQTQTASQNSTQNNTQPTSNATAQNQTATQNSTQIGVNSTQQSHPQNSTLNQTPAASKNATQNETK